jgi:hypothetical protein
MSTINNFVKGKSPSFARIFEKRETALNLAAVKEKNVTLTAEVKKLQQLDANYMITIHRVPKEEPMLNVVGKIGDLLDITVEEHQIADKYRIRTKKIQGSAPVLLSFMITEIVDNE